MNQIPFVKYIIDQIKYTEEVSDLNHLLREGGSSYDSESSISYNRIPGNTFFIKMGFLEKAIDELEIYGIYISKDKKYPFSFDKEYDFVTFNFSYRRNKNV